MVMHQDRNQPKFNKSTANKGKRIPQRGLGVEKLEKLRIEGQRKKDISTTSPPPPAQAVNFYRPETMHSLGRGSTMRNAQEMKHFSPIWLMNKEKSMATEPPSNQSYSLRNHTMHLTSQTDEGKSPTKMTGSNLLLPFHRDESMKFGYNDIGISKECVSSSSAYHADWRNSEVRTDKGLRENGAFSESGFLTLGLQSQGGVNKDVEQSENSSEKFLRPFLPVEKTNERDEAAVDVDTRLKL